MPTHDRAVLVDMIERGDLVEAAGRQWLLVPVDAPQLDALAAFAADLADLEPTTGNGTCAGPGVDQRLWAAAGMVADDIEDGHDREEPGSWD